MWPQPTVSMSPCSRASFIPSLDQATSLLELAQVARTPPLKAWQKA